MLKKVLLLSLCAVFLLMGCGKEKAPEESDPNTIDLPEDNPEEPEDIVYPEVEPESDETYRLRTDVSEEYRDISLNVGESINVPRRQGYTFHGYHDARQGEGVQYIDETGKLVKEYHGTKKPLVLWPYYTANKYRITICENGSPLTECSELVCPYDENICDDLPWGKEIVKDRKIDDDESYVITGFLVDDYKLTLEDKGRKLLFNKLEMYADHGKETLELDVITSDITYLWNERLSSRRITNKGFLEQKVNENKKPYDYFSIAEDVDLEALKELGYKDVEITLTITVGQGKGTPTVSVTTKKASKAKDVEENAIIETGKIKTEDLDKTGQFVESYTIPVKRIKDSFFVYYNSDNWGNGTWSCDAISLEFEFVK